MTRAAEPPRVLVVDDQAQMAEALCDSLADAGLAAVPAGSSRRALQLLQEERFDALVTDLRMPEIDGLRLLAESRRLRPERPVIVMTAYGAVDSAIESIRQGAYHYLTKPFKVEELILFLRRALEEAGVRREASALRTALRERFSRSAMVGESRPMRALFDTLDRVAGADVPLLLGGETGTGKGLLARVIHAESPRAGGPFVTVNCAALPEALLESELFGHEKGAFTGATSARRGLFAEAEGGTLFLDEIGDLPPGVQAKLLHVLEAGAVRPVGSNREQPVDVRVLAATHRDLHEAAAAGRFRPDLLYRLDVVSLALPALRHRREDLPLLIERFFGEQRARHPASPARAISPDAMERLLAYRWPGNVRELAHTIERAVLLCAGPEVQVADLPPALRGGAAPGPLFEGEILPVRVLQRRYAAWALDQMGGHRGRTAERLGVDVKTLNSWLKEDREEP